MGAVQRLNMRRISSSLTWWHKKAFPAIWFGFLGLFTVAWIPGVILQQVPAPTLLIPLGMAAFGYVLMRLLVFPLVDEVWIEDNEIIVRNRGQEERFPITNIMNVEASLFVNPSALSSCSKNPADLAARLCSRHLSGGGISPDIRLPFEQLGEIRLQTGLELDRADRGRAADVEDMNDASGDSRAANDLPTSSVRSCMAPGPRVCTTISS
jgi:hypothetical protein